jgi:hypothetical protein
MKLKDFTNKKNIDPRPSVKFGCAIDRFWDDNNDPLDPNNYYSIGELIDYIQHSNHFSLNGLTGEVELTSNDQSIGIAVGSDNKIDLSVSKAPTSQNQQFAYRSASHDYDNFRIMTLTSPDTKLKY